MYIIQCYIIIGMHIIRKVTNSTATGFILNTHQHANILHYKCMHADTHIIISSP